MEKENRVDFLLPPLLRGKKVNFVVIEFTNYANMVGSNYFRLKNK
jgi:hypothetical protein